ncbi:MAG: hypothetical protein IJ479_06350 [Alphaproteobacteria bacterium]|nr:hypothetical protein [Alphaproteobacteria bacterium]
MKKILLFSFLFLVGCASFTLKRNENCLDSTEFEIFQTLDTSAALATECTISRGCSSFNKTVLLLPQVDIEYYDQMIVKIPENKCPIIMGTYRYTSKDERERTVPIIDFAYEYEPANEEEKIIRQISGFRGFVFYKCSEAKERSICSCATEEIFQEFLATLKNDGINIFSDKKEVSKMVKSAEQNCGKLPKNYVDELNKTLGKIQFSVNTQKNEQ